jgi:hypothetical protein
MVFHGTFKNGVVVLDEKTGLPEGQRVQVNVEQDDRPPTEPTVWQELSKFAGTIRSGHSDASRNHDHYLYGAPKREPEE